MLSISDNPPVATPGYESVAAMPGTWWVGHTKSRFEKAFAWDLYHQGVDYFLPMIERVRVSGGRKRRGMAALFPSYVFFCGDDDSRYKALRTNRLCRAIEVQDQATLTDELGQIELALTGKADLDPYPFAAVGNRCRVTAGPCRGLQGTVVRRNGKARLVLEVTILGQGAFLDIETDLLEPVD